MDALFLDHFERELAYLRELGSEFAARYPKLAGRLGMDEFHCSDPFVERLLEGFAFMAARVQRRLDSEFPQLTRSLIDAVFPHYGRPIPSAGIFQLNPAHDEGSLIEGYLVPKGTRLHASPARGEQTGCRFDTVDDCILWPLRVANAQFFSRDSVASVPTPRGFQQSAIQSGLWITLESTVAVPVGKIKLDRFKLHLRGSEIAHQLFELLMAHGCSLSVATSTRGQLLKSDNWVVGDVDNIRATAFEKDRPLMPEDCRSFSGYRLLQEYFLLPERFLFVEISDLQRHLAGSEGNQLHLLVGFDSRLVNLVGRVSAEHFGLHCVPGVNLFRRRADRIHLDHTQHEHQLISDRSRPLDFEIWSIAEMAGHETASTKEIPCLPLYATPEAKEAKGHSAVHYSSERRPRVHSERTSHPHRTAYAGTELFVTLTNGGTSPLHASIQQLSSLLWCTNRDLPLLVPEGGWRNAFRVEAAGPIASVVCLTGPTAPRPPLISEDGEAAWRLISHLTPNYLSLMSSESNHGATMLREMLQLYCAADDHSSLRQIEGLQSISCKPTVRRIPAPGPMTFARGIEVELLCDEDAFEGGRAFLLGSVIEQFLARYVSLNSFTEFQLTSTRRGTIHHWPARIGTAPSL